MYEDAQGPPLLTEEFELTLTDSKTGKTASVDEIGLPAKLLKALGRQGRQELFDICSRIYVQGEWPQDFVDAIIICLEKNGAQKCVDFRTIRLMPHASK